ncbi:uncharacterized protein LOC115621531 [Scaptodrosophila lebanonensis]|uniref:Uncharacterized protein LOC115621531 n=1 Tax=Drosophila lebanonensis TaxID=7225 RepID=A0A6J2T2B7_DROLE|nr:uncharacterized protein LOC115621531 [Scaptodrosophila lebanonensis]
MLRTMQRSTRTTVRRLATYGARYGYLGTLLRRNESYYDVLNVPVDSSGQEIKRAFIKLSKKYHPDSNSSACDSEAFVKICEAYKTLYNTATRNEYDNRLKLQLDVCKPMENCYTNHNVHKTWEKYKAAMRYKQRGRDVKSTIESTMAHRKPLVSKTNQLQQKFSSPRENEVVLEMPIAMHRIAVEEMKCKANTECPPEPEIACELELEPDPDPAWHRSWPYMSYVTGFGIVLSLGAYALRERLKSRRIR